MKIRVLSAVITLGIYLLPHHHAAAQNDGLSDTDMKALYCLGAIKAKTELVGQWYQQTLSGLNSSTQGSPQHLAYQQSADAINKTYRNLEAAKNRVFGYVLTKNLMNRPDGGFLIVAGQGENDIRACMSEATSENTTSCTNPCISRSNTQTYDVMTACSTECQPKI